MSILFFFPLFWTILYDHYIPKQTSIITLLRYLLGLLVQVALLFPGHVTRNVSPLTGCEVTAEVRESASDQLFMN